jgi:thiosulfate dehydrogenase
MRYRLACQACHGSDGAGYRTLVQRQGTSYVTPPLWGTTSYNNGAGMDRILTAAGFILANMPVGTPYDRPVLTNDQAFDVAGYFNSHYRPTKADLKQDYPHLWTKPVDCPYGPYADGFSKNQHKYGPFLPLIKAHEQAAKEDKTGK